MMVIMLIALLVVAFLALLYAYRAQTPVISPTPTIASVSLVDGSGSERAREDGIQRMIDHAGEDSSALPLFFLVPIVLFGGVTALAESPYRGRAD